MHIREEGKLEKGVPPAKLDTAPGVGTAIGEQFVPDEVGEARCSFARAGSLASRPNSCHQEWLGAMAPKSPKQTYYVGRIVLPISVHGRDDRKAGGKHTCPERCTFLCPLIMTEITQARISAQKCPNFSPSPVIASIVDGYHLAERSFRHFGEGLLNQGANIAFLVKCWDDNRNAHEDELPKRRLSTILVEYIGPCGSGRVRRSVIEQIGVLDELFFSVGDRGFCQRARAIVSSLCKEAPLFGMDQIFRALGRSSASECSPEETAQGAGHLLAILHGCTNRFGNQDCQRWPDFCTARATLWFDSKESAQKVVRISTPDIAHSAAPGKRWRAIDSLCRAVDRSPRLVTFLAAALSLTLTAGLTFRRATTPWSVLPDNDYWGNIRGLIPEKGVTLDLWSLLHHNNEHVVIIPKLIYMANYLLTSGSNIGLTVYSILAGSVCAAILLLLARDLLHDTPTRWAFCAVLFPLAMFSGKLSHSYYFGMSGAQWLTANIFVIASAAAMAKAAQAESTRWLLASLLAALLGVLSYSTAIYSLLVLLVFCGILLLVPKFRGRFPWPVLVGMAALILLVLTVWLILRPHPQGHPPLDFDPIGLAGFILIYVGSALSEGYLAPVTGLAFLAVGAIAIYRLLADGRGILLWVTLFLFAPFNALMTGIGRLGFGMKAAFSSRYQSVTVISIIALMALVLAALPKDNARRSVGLRSVGMAVLLIAAVFFVTNNKTIKMYAKRLERKPIAEIALRLDIAGDRHIQAATKAMEQLYNSLPALRAAHHVPFNTRSRCEEMLGQHLVAQSKVSAGSIDDVTVYTVSHETRTAIELSGWALHEGRPAECIAVVDGEKIVIGAGTSSGLRPAPLRSDRCGLDGKQWRAIPKGCRSARLPCFPVLAPGFPCQLSGGSSRGA